jgi:hypothetical protein
MLANPAGTGERVATIAGTVRGVHGYTARHGFAMWHGMAGWAAWERHFLRWARPPAIASTSPAARLDRDRDLHKRYRLRGVGHDEYWSAGMRSRRPSSREAVTSCSSRGRTCYWQIASRDGAGPAASILPRRPVHGTDRRASTATIWSDPN